MMSSTDHIPAPSGHAPRLETLVSISGRRVVVRERDSEEAWIGADIDGCLEVSQ